MSVNHCLSFYVPAGKGSSCLQNSYLEDWLDWIYLTYPSMGTIRMLKFSSPTPFNLKLPTGLLANLLQEDFDSTSSRMSISLVQSGQKFIWNFQKCNVDCKKRFVLFIFFLKTVCMSWLKLPLWFVSIAGARHTSISSVASLFSYWAIQDKSHQVVPRFPPTGYEILSPAVSRWEAGTDR